jgi:hypothetical protein
VAYNFQTGNKKIKLLTEYESVTQKVLFSIELVPQNAKQLQNSCLSWQVVSIDLVPVSGNLYLKYNSGNFHRY